MFLKTTAEHPDPVVTCTTPPCGVTLSWTQPGGTFSVTVLLPNLTLSKRALPVSSFTAVCDELPPSVNVNWATGTTTSPTGLNVSLSTRMHPDGELLLLLLNFTLDALLMEWEDTEELLVLLILVADDEELLACAQTQHWPSHFPTWQMLEHFGANPGPQLRSTILQIFSRKVALQLKLVGQMPELLEALLLLEDTLEPLLLLEDTLEPLLDLEEVLALEDLIDDMEELLATPQVQHWPLQILS